MIDSIKDHLIPQVSQKRTTKRMFDILKELFENSNVNRALALKQQLSNIKMTRTDSVASYFIKITELKDQLGTIGEVVADREIVMMTLNGLPNS